MLLKIGKMTPQCSKSLPSDEYTSDSQLPDFFAEGALPWLGGISHFGKPPMPQQSTPNALPPPPLLQEIS
jgi:hypothetical protein